MDVYEKLDNTAVSSFIGAKTTLLHKMGIDGDYADVSITDELDSPWHIKGAALIVQGQGYDTHIVGAGITDDFTLVRLQSGQVVVLWNAEMEMRPE